MICMIFDYVLFLINNNNNNNNIIIKNVLLIEINEETNYDIKTNNS